MHDTENVANTRNEYYTSQPKVPTPTQDIIDAGVQIGMLRDRLHAAEDTLRSIVSEIHEACVGVGPAVLENSGTTLMVLPTPIEKLSFLKRNRLDLLNSLTDERVKRAGAVARAKSLESDAARSVPLSELIARDKIIEGYTTEIDKLAEKVVDIEAQASAAQATLDGIDKVLTEAAYQYDRAKVSNPNGGPQLDGLAPVEKVRAFGRWLDARHIAACDETRMAEREHAKDRSALLLAAELAKTLGEFAIALIAAQAPTATPFTLEEIRDMPSVRRAGIIEDLTHGTKRDRAMLAKQDSELHEIRRLVEGSLMDGNATGQPNRPLRELVGDLVTRHKAALGYLTDATVLIDARNAIAEMLAYASDRVRDEEREIMQHPKDGVAYKRAVEWLNCLIPVSATLQEIAKKHGFEPSEA